MAKQQVPEIQFPIQDCNYTNATLNRLFSKLGDIIAQQQPPKNMKNLQYQSANMTVGFPLDSLKRHSASIHNLSEQIEFLQSSMDDECEDTISCDSIAQSIEMTLRNAKSQGLECGEVLVPSDLTTRVAEDVVQMSEDEPCGVRGCVIYINYEDKTVCRRIGKVRCDPNSVPTFEVVLTLRPDTNSWFRILPLKNCLKKFRNATLVVSSGYSLAKNKLYRSNQSSS